MDVLLLTLRPLFARSGLLALALTLSVQASVSFGQGVFGNRSYFWDSPRAMALLMKYQRPDALPARLRKELALHAGLDEAALERPEVIQSLFNRLPESEKYILTQGLKLSEIQELHRETGPFPERTTQLRLEREADYIHEWGAELLPSDDPIFSEPHYLYQVLDHTGPRAIWTDRKKRNEVLIDFQNAWAALAPQNTEPKVFTLTGSDAGNRLYSLAAKHEQWRRKGLFGSNRERSDVEILFFEGIWGAGSGRLSHANFRNQSKEMAQYQIPGPHTYELDPKDPVEIKRITDLENQALQFIRKKTAKGRSILSGAKPIGGVLIEPILGPKGVYFYRTEFMKRLRTLCDELQIPIFADEVLTGGGRTGRFFAYQHYEGFEPDYITFGKGLHVSGIASVARPGFPNYLSTGESTVYQYYGPLLTATQVLRKIHEDRLIENAKAVGEYFLQRLKDESTKNNLGFFPRGAGLLLYTRETNFNDMRPVRTGHGRLMPYLTMTKEQVDQRIKDRQY